MHQITRRKPSRIVPVSRTGVMRLGRAARFRFSPARMNNIEFDRALWVGRRAMFELGFEFGADRGSLPGIITRVRGGAMVQMFVPALARNVEVCIDMISLV